MITPASPDNEPERLKDLKTYDILDTLPEEEYDNITQIASQICQTPISLITLVDEKRQWFKSHHGLSVTETPREHAFCAHAIHNPNEILVVPDSRLDERFHDNPLVTGEPHVIFYTGVPLVSPQGHSLGTLCVIDNEPRSLDQGQIKSLQALSRQVVKMLELRKSKKLLQDANEALKKINQGLEQFARIAAHDIKSPLNNISQLIELLLQNHATNLDDEGKELIKLMGTSTLHLRQLVDGILSYSKSEKLLSEEREKVNMGNFIKEIISLLDFAGENTFTYPKNTQEITVNKVALEQILVNLISNSLKYNNKDRASIEIGVAVYGKYYEFYVKDNGPGIKKEDQDKIFKIFEVSHLRDRAGVRGSGIGLATVKKLVEGQGGKVRVSSATGEGATFHFTIAK